MTLFLKSVILLITKILMSLCTLGVCESMRFGSKPAVPSLAGKNNL